MALSSKEKLAYLRELCKEIAKLPNYQQDHNTDSISYDAEGLFAYCTPGWPQINNDEDWPTDDNVKIEVMREINTIPQDTEWVDYKLCFSTELDLGRYTSIMHWWVKTEQRKEREPYETDFNKSKNLKELWQLGIERGQRMNTCVAQKPRVNMYTVKRTYSYYHDIEAENREEALLLSETKAVDLAYLEIDEYDGDNYYVHKN